MKKWYLLSAVGVAGAGAAYLITRQNGQKKDASFHSTLENAGVPDQTDEKDLAQLENAKMVSEGSQFGVKYYNEVMENKSEEG